MKTLLATALLIGLGLGSVQASDENISFSDMTMVKAQDQRLRVVLQEGIGKVRVSILDANGKYLHQSRLNADRNLIVPFDLSQLPVGEYQVKIKQRGGDEQKVIHHVVTEAKKPEFKPLVAFSRKIDDRAFELTVVGLKEPGVRVQIADVFGRQIFDYTVDHPEAFTKVYRMKNKNVEGVSVRLTDALGRTKSFVL
ncbi:hypothetical protein [Cecembia lonarensis]|uniref:Secretion system C-terminal sorting domain-containing protein n=1 Tax=Cecembia lonarensis (strain CCUG 58316 / KCTC 22772 / LW9) TaxID=1225176 RepID=K1L5U9_CECL9|nr:hypothetical protein [Cecembia lonarensis]EKB47457.1 hypothetical protein B879_03945 [Cecembia lonarensis LW9]